MANLYEAHARVKVEVPDGFHLAEWKCMDMDLVGTNDLSRRVQITFREAPLLADGEVAWKYAGKKRIKVVITHGEHLAWIRAWEARTGLCHQCDQKHPGLEVMGVSVKDGVRRETCRRCKGTGKSPEVAHV